jgi:hypothetical protein
MRELTPIALDHFSGRDPIGRSPPKGCSRSVRPPRMSQATAGMKRERNWGLEERIWAKEIKNKNVFDDTTSIHPNRGPNNCDGPRDWT